jgi:hypothetical protein
MKGHPGVLMIDHFEPDVIIHGLVPAVPTAVLPLNSGWNKADYYMVDPQGNERMVERKQLSEALSDLNAVEEQLGRHLSECTELTLLVEGVGLSTSQGVQTYWYTKTGAGPRYGRVPPGWYAGYEHKNQPQLWSRWHAFKYSLWHNAGIHVEETSDWTGTVQFLSTWFNKAMDPTSTTMSRYVVPHMAPFNKDPHVDNLCRMKGMDIGEATALKLVAELGSFYGVMSARYVDLVGIMGGAWARQFFTAIGREE